MNKKKILLLVVLLAVSAGVGTVSADIGLGIILGDPTGISLLIEERIALGAAWSLYNHFHIHVDVWILNPGIVENLEWYLGVGGKFKIFTADSIKKETPDDLAVGVRVPVGLQYYVIPELELFIEAAPGIQLFPATAFDVDAGLGIRYHF
jgi:hypothetical protein